MPAFFTLDGLDGTGKSTQCRRLADRLRGLGLTVTTCVEPGGTPLGQSLRQIVLDAKQEAMSVRAELLIFMASRAQLVDTVIRPALAAGHVVISDRFLLASVVYQGHAGGLGPADVWRIGAFATGGLEPDLTVVYDLPEADARARRARPADRIESRGIEFDRKVRRGFLAEAAASPSQICVIDAARSEDAIHADTFAAAAEVLRRKGVAL